MGWFSWWPQRRVVWGVNPEEATVHFRGEDLRAILGDETELADLVIRPAFGGDHIRIERVRRANREWLGKWEATLPEGAKEALPTWEQYPRLMDKKTTKGEALVMVVEVEGEVAGVVTLGAIEWGAIRGGILGYWIAEKWAGKGITSLAVAATIDLLLGPLQLHRVDVNVKPDNVPSLGLCRKLRMREEGYKVRYMNINGQWADHVAFAVDREMITNQGLVQQLRARAHLNRK